MDLLDRILGHDAWTTREMLLRCRELSDEALDRKFEIGHGSLRATFVHIIWNIEVWTDLMCERAVRGRPGKEAATIARLIERLEGAAAVMRAGGGGMVHVGTHSMHHGAEVLNMMRQLGMKDLIEGDALSWEE